MLELREVATPQDGIVLSQRDVAAKNRSRNFGNGMLYVTEQCVCWISDAHSVDGNSLASEHANQPGLLLSYYDISLHAISKDPSSFPEECIYMLLDGARGADPGAHSEIDDGENGESMEEDADSALEEGTTDTKELCFVPRDKSTLEAIFTAMSTCQALHPDPDDASSGSEDGEGEDGVGENMDDTAPENLVHAVAEDHQFEDDVEEEDGSGDGPTNGH